LHADFTSCDDKPPNHFSKGNFEMAKKGQSLVDYSKRSQDAPKIKQFRDPVSGRDITNIQSPKPIGGLSQKVFAPSRKPGNSKA
jgi:hypothetical protein